MHVPLSTLLNWQVVKLYWVLPPKNTFSDEDIIFQNVSPEHLTFILCLGQLPSSMCALLFLKWLNIHSQLKHIHRVLNTSRFFVKKNSFPDTFQGSRILSPLVLYCISSSNSSSHLLAVRYIWSTKHTLACIDTNIDYIKGIF